MSVGSVYCDVSLRASGMNGESVRSGSVLVVKTHHRVKQEWTVKKKLEFGKNVNPITVQCTVHINYTNWKSNIAYIVK